MNKKIIKFDSICNFIWHLGSKEEISKELENITNAMNDYYSSLLAIENIIKNWDPFKKANIKNILQNFNYYLLIFKNYFIELFLYLFEGYTVYGEEQNFENW